MKFEKLLRFSVLLIIGGLLSGCGTSGGNNPSSLFKGAVFISDRDGPSELFITDAEAKTVTKLSSAGPVGNVISFLASPNTGFIAYLADQDIVGVNELYFLKKTVNTAGVLGVEGPVKINTDLAAGQNVTQYEWSPGPISDFIAYVADQDTPTINDLYVTDARTIEKVSPDGMMGNVINFKWSPDSATSGTKKIAFMAQLTPANPVELYVAERQSDGSFITTQVSDSTIGAGPTEYEWSPDSSLIAYISDQEFVGVFDLFTTNVDDLASTKVTDITTGAVKSFAWSHGGSLLAYSANLTDPVAVIDINLFTTNPADNTNVLIVSDVIPAGGAVQNSFLWSPSDTALAYVADQDAAGTFELYIADPVTASSSVKVSTGDVDSVDGFIWNLFSNQLIYRGDQDSDTNFELYVTTIDTGVSTSIVQISGSEAVAEEFILSPFGNVVSYLAHETVGVSELFATNLTDNTSVLKVSADLSTTNQDVIQHDWSSDGTKILYVADETSDEVFDIYTNTVNAIDSLNLSVSSATDDIKQAALIDGFGVSENLVAP